MAVFSGTIRRARNRWLLLAACLLAAITVLPRTANASVPQPPDPLAVARQRLQAGQWGAAETELNQLLRSHPRSAGLYDLRGVAEAGQQKTTAAETDFATAIRLAPHLTGAYLNLARLQVSEGRAIAALATLRRLLAFDPGNPSANLQSAQLLLENRHYARSLAHLRRLPQISRAQPASLALECADESGLGHHQRAAALADRILHSPGLQARDLAWLLPELQREKQYGPQVRLLQGLRTRGLATADTEDRLAAVYLAMGQPRAARAVLLRLQQSFPSQPRYLLQLARVAALQNNIREALGYLAHARALAPNDAAIPFLMGGLCQRRGMAVQAYQLYEDAVRLAPANPDYLQALGQSALPLPTHVKEAVAVFRRYQQVRPGDERAPLYLARALLDAGEAGQAAPLLRRLTRQPRVAPGAWFSLGLLEMRQGHLHAAQSALRQSLRLRPAEPNARAQLGVVEVQLHQYAAAAKDLDAALAADPANFPASFNLALVYQRLHDPRAAAQRRRVAQLRAILKQQRQRALTMLRVVPNDQER